MNKRELRTNPFDFPELERISTEDLLESRIFELLLANSSSAGNWEDQSIRKFDLYEEKIVKFFEKSLVEQKNKSTVSLTMKFLREKVNEIETEGLSPLERTKIELLSKFTLLLDSFPVRDAVNLKKIFNVHKTLSVQERMNKY